MGRFLDMLKKINLNLPFLEVLKEVPSYLNFWGNFYPKRVRSGKFEWCPLEKLVVRF